MREGESSGELESARFFRRCNLCTSAFPPPSPRSAAFCSRSLFSRARMRVCARASVRVFQPAPHLVFFILPRRGDTLPRILLVSPGCEISRRIPWRRNDLGLPLPVNGP